MKCLEFTFRLQGHSEESIYIILCDKNPFAMYTLIRLNSFKHIEFYMHRRGTLQDSY